MREPVHHPLSLNPNQHNELHIAVAPYVLQMRHSRICPPPRLRLRFEFHSVLTRTPRVKMRFQITRPSLNCN